jgi:hypothetical protein
MGAQAAQGTNQWGFNPYGEQLRRRDATQQQACQRQRCAQRCPDHASCMHATLCWAHAAACDSSSRGPPHRTAAGSLWCPHPRMHPAAGGFGGFGGSQSNSWANAAANSGSFGSPWGGSNSFANAAASAGSSSMGKCFCWSCMRVPLAGPGVVVLVLQQQCDAVRSTTTVAVAHGWCHCFLLVLPAHAARCGVCCALLPALALPRSPPPRPPHTQALASACASC